MVRKNHFARNKSNIFVLVVFVVISYILIKYELLLDSNFERETHLDILTINSIFAGFLFTGLGIMVGFSDKKRIANKDKNGYMDRYYNSIYMGLLFLIISIILSVLGFVFPDLMNYRGFVETEQLTLIAGILYFVLSVVNIYRIIKDIRNNL